MRYLFTLSLLFIAGILSAQQGVAINTDGSAPHASDMLAEICFLAGTL